MTPKEKREARAADWSKLVKWIYASDHRYKLLESVARRNRAGERPNQTWAMATSKRPYGSMSVFNNGSQAIRDLIAEGLLVNKNPKRGEAQLEVAWDFVGVISDWQEERGEPRLDKKLREC